MAALKPKPVDPLAPMSPQGINSAVGKYVGMYGQPQSDQQIQATAQGELDPIIAAITKTANDRATASTQAIKGLTNSYAQDLGQIDFASPYNTAASDQAAVDSALQQSLNGAGSDLASQLKARLAPIGGDPAVGQAAAGLADRGTAIGTTQLAQGSNALSSLLANAAAAGNYGLKLPALAKLSGLQGVNQANANAANEISSGTQSALGQLPSIVNALRSDNTGLRANRASAAANLFTTLTGQNVTKATAKAGLQNQAFDNTISAANAAANQNYKAATANERVRHDKAVEAAKQKTSGTAKPLSPSEARVVASKANTLAAVAFKGGTDSKGNALKPLTYQQALDEARQEGLLADPRSARITMNALNRLYREGQRGRPLSKKSKATLQAAIGAMPSPPLDALLGGH